MIVDEALWYKVYTKNKEISVNIKSVVDVG